jgi:uncharacterized protein (DUF1697 family)
VAERVYLALLRGVNVSGHNQLPMKHLRTLIEATGADKVETYLQSGNAVFQSTIADPQRLRQAIEAGLHAQLGLEIVVVVRSAEELDRVVAANPLGTDDRDRSRLHVTFLAATPEYARVAALEAARDAAIEKAAEASASPASPDEFRIRQREVYLYCPDGYGRTKLNNAFFERKLAVAATTRNWRTVTTLVEMAHR